MKKRRHTKKRKGYPWYYLSAGLVLFCASAFLSYYYLRPILSFESSFIEEIESRDDGNGKPDDEGDASGRLYTSRENGRYVGRRFNRDAYLVIAEDVIKKYMEDKQGKLVDLYMDREGTVYADFSSELKKNFRGDAFEEYKIISDLYKRLRINIPRFRSLKILINGREEESLGGHIIITKPIEAGIEYDRQRKTDRYF
jgi:hypothetical protein